ncbi:radical SAM protein [Candidatus Omnitrophota bacterium]
MDPSRYPKQIERDFALRLNKNQKIQVERLVYELIKAKKMTYAGIVRSIGHDLREINPQGKDRFQHIKKTLVSLRYPVTCARAAIDPNDLFLNKLKTAKKEAYHPGKCFTPKRVIVETQVKDSDLVTTIRRLFPKITIEFTEYYSRFLKDYRLTPHNLKQPLLFVVKEKWDFVKKCPCTKKHLGCGYWILNLGFGCPYDCSYCYLQHYQNFPGVVLPANIDDFFATFDLFFKKIGRPIRIGTGEFCDSLALDHITGYSRRLIDFFSQRPVLFELKTKSAHIENILQQEPAGNIVISWSLNPRKIVDSEEYGVASLAQRLDAARTVQKKGYKVAFHFDPIIYYDRWADDYRKLVEKLYQKVKPPLAWISLGTLRFARQLKPAMEQRFQQSNIVYGELFVGEDKKLRYPEFLRIEIYRNMVKWIKRFDRKTPLYLCMESTTTWGQALMKVDAASQVEKHLLKDNVKA